MTTLASMASVSLTLANNGFLEVSTNGGFGSVTITPVGGAAVAESWGPSPFRKRFAGPYPEGAAVLLTNASSASMDYETDGSNLPTAVQSLVSGAGKREYWPSDLTALGLAGLAAAISLAGGGTINLPPQRIPLTAGLPMYTNVSWLGTEPTMAYASTVPDNGGPFVSGTWFDMTGVNAPLFSANTTPSGSNPANAQGGISNATIKNIGLQGGTNMINCGATNVFGPLFCHFENLYVRGCTGRSFIFMNHAHCRGSALKAIDCGGAAFIGQDMANVVLQCGNSEWDGLFNKTSGQRNSDGYWFGSMQAGQNGGISTFGRVQNNAFNRVEYTATATITAGTANITVPDGTQFPVDMPVVFSAALGNLVAQTGLAYYVVSQVGNTIQVSTDWRDTPVIPNTTGSLTIKTFGKALLTIGSAGVGASWVSLDFRGLDLEGSSSVPLVMHRSSAISLNIKSLPDVNASYFHVSLRNNQQVDFSGGVAMKVENYLGSGLYVTSKGVSQYSASSGTPLVGVYYNEANGTNPVLQLGRYVGAAGNASLMNRSPGNQDWTVPGLALGVKQGYVVGNVTFLNTGSAPAGFGVFTGGSAGTWTTNFGMSSSTQGYRQTIKNGSTTGGATLDVTLGASDGTYDGLTGGTSLGKTIRLQPGSATTPGGILSIVCCQIGASSYQWQIEALTNGAFV